jgi:hypothetical protein
VRGTNNGVRSGGQPRIRVASGKRWTPEVRRRAPAHRENWANRNEQDTERIDSARREEGYFLLILTDRPDIPDLRIKIAKGVPILMILGEPFKMSAVA